MVNKGVRELKTNYGWERMYMFMREIYNQGIKQCQSKSKLAESLGLNSRSEQFIRLYKLLKTNEMVEEERDVHNIKLSLHLKKISKFIVRNSEEYSKWERFKNKRFVYEPLHMD